MTKDASLKLSVPPDAGDVAVETKIVNLLLTKLADYLIPESEAFNQSGWVLALHYDGQYNYSECNDSQHNDSQYNDRQHIGSQQNVS